MKQKYLVLIYYFFFLFCFILCLFTTSFIYYLSCVSSNFCVFIAVCLVTINFIWCQWIFFYVTFDSVFDYVMFFSSFVLIAFYVFFFCNNCSTNFNSFYSLNSHHIQCNLNQSKFCKALHLVFTASSHSNYI